MISLDEGASLAKPVPAGQGIEFQAGLRKQSPYVSDGLVCLPNIPIRHHSVPIFLINPDLDRENQTTPVTSIGKVRKMKRDLLLWRGLLVGGTTSRVVRADPVRTEVDPPSRAAWAKRPIGDRAYMAAALWCSRGR